MTDAESDRPYDAVEEARLDAQVKERAGQSNALEGSGSSHTLVVFAEANIDIGPLLHEISLQREAVSAAI